MNILVCKQDHFGDPDPLRGTWGETGCYGRVRGLSFDGVIGIGANTAESPIIGKLTWGGLFPHKIGHHDDGHPILTFKHFFHWGSKGSLLEADFPLIARRTEGHFRFSIEDLSHSMAAWDIKRIYLILELAPRSAATTPKKRVC
jgi:hypothetical protein